MTAGGSVKQAILATPDELASYIPSELMLNATLFNFKVVFAAQLTKAERHLTWEIFASNMESFYMNSSFGWDPPSKKRELFHRLGRFILVRPGQDEESPVVAFATFRFEREEDENVVYCYEVQVAQDFHGYGLGKHLMQCLWEVGRGKQLDKVMLTVFKANQSALKFYRKIGFNVDPTSPGYTSPSEEWVDEDEDECDYEIMSKVILPAEGGE